MTMKRNALRSVAACSAFIISAPALAQLGACPILQPPPCIVMDLSKIAQHAAVLTKRAAEIEQYVQQVKTYTDVNRALGAAGIGKLAPIAKLPAIDPVTPESSAQISNELISALNIPNDSIETREDAGRQRKLRIRDAALHAKALADMMKLRLADLDKQANDLQGESSSSLRNDWENNSRARTLMLVAMNQYKEVVATGVSLRSLQHIPSAMPNASGFPDPGTYTPATTGTGLSQQLADLQDASQKLLALKAAQQTLDSYTSSISLDRETQNQYQAMLQAAQQAQGQVQAQANATAGNKHIPASTIMATVNAYMANDTTTWDDPSKADSAKYWAGKAKSQLDKMVSGDVTDDWIDLLQTRAEAAKEEAFFRQTNVDAIANEASDRASLASFAAQQGVDSASLAQQLQQAQSNLDKANAALSSASGDDAAKRDQILSDLRASPIMSAEANPQ